MTLGFNFKNTVTSNHSGDHRVKVDRNSNDSNLNQHRFSLLLLRELSQLSQSMDSALPLHILCVDDFWSRTNKCINHFSARMGRRSLREFIELKYNNHSWFFLSKIKKQSFYSTSVKKSWSSILKGYNQRFSLFFICISLPSRLWDTNSSGNYRVCHASAYYSILTKENQSLCGGQKTVMVWHARFGDLVMQHDQFIIRQVFSLNT